MRSVSPLSAPTSRSSRCAWAPPRPARSSCLAGAPTWAAPNRVAAGVLEQVGVDPSAYLGSVSPLHWF